MKPVEKRRATGVLAEMLANLDMKELARTRKRMMLAMKIADSMRNARFTVTDDGIEGVLTWEQIYALLKVINESTWKDAQGDDLPEIDREVVALTQNIPNDAGMYRVVFAHRPDPQGYHILGDDMVGIKTYGKGEWNQPDVKWWLDLDIPGDE